MIVFRQHYHKGLYSAMEAHDCLVNSRLPVMRTFWAQITLGES